MARKRGTHGREVEGVADPEADPVGPRHDGGEQQLGDVQLEEEGEEGIGVDVERVGPVVRGRWWRAGRGRKGTRRGGARFESICVLTWGHTSRAERGVKAWQAVVCPHEAWRNAPLDFLICRVDVGRVSQEPVRQGPAKAKET